MEAALIKVAEWARYPNPDDLAFNDDDKKDVPKNIKTTSTSITKTSKTTRNKKATGQKEAKEEKSAGMFCKIDSYFFPTKTEWILQRLQGNNYDVI